MGAACLPWHEPGGLRSDFFRLACAAQLNRFASTRGGRCCAPIGVSRVGRVVDPPISFVYPTAGIRVRPSREFAPAGDLLFERPKRRQKVAPAPSPSALLRVPCASRSPRPARNSLRYAAVRQPRGVSSRSALRARLDALRCSAPPKGSAEQPKTRGCYRSPVTCASFGALMRYSAVNRWLWPAASGSSHSTHPGCLRQA